MMVYGPIVVIDNNTDQPTDPVKEVDSLTYGRAQMKEFLQRLAIRILSLASEPVCMKLCLTLQK